MSYEEYCLKNIKEGKYIILDRLNWGMYASRGFLLNFKPIARFCNLNTIESLLNFPSALLDTLICYENIQKKLAIAFQWADVFQHILGKKLRSCSSIEWFFSRLRIVLCSGLAACLLSG